MTFIGRPVLRFIPMLELTQDRLTISAAVKYTPQYEPRTATPRALLIAVLAFELFIFRSTVGAETGLMVTVNWRVVALDPEVKVSTKV